eukprot:scaffold1800_cov87-Cyclotella_meneghiniana.AAC.4
MPSIRPLPFISVICLLFLLFVQFEAQCGPAMSFIAREKELLKDLSITPEQHCSQFDTKSICKADEYELCNWCDTHKPDSDSENKTSRCVPASYHWFHCERAIAPPRERIKHKFEWGKKKKDEQVADAIDAVVTSEIIEHAENEEL